jgi:hypothetical protein
VWHTPFVSEVDDAAARVEQPTSEKRVVTLADVILVTVGVIAYRHWRVCAKGPVAKAVFLEFETVVMVLEAVIVGAGVAFIRLG